MVHGYDLYIYYGFETSEKDCLRILDILDPKQDTKIPFIHQLIPQNLRFLKTFFPDISESDIITHPNISSYKYYCMQKVDVKFIEYSQHALMSNNIGFDSVHDTKIIDYLKNIQEIKFDEQFMDILSKHDSYTLETAIIPYITRNITNIPKIIKYFENKNPRYTDEEIKELLENEDPMYRFLDYGGSSFGPVKLPTETVQRIVKDMLKEPELDNLIIKTLQQLDIPIPECKWYIYKNAY
jgi:hypothetical protein